MSLKRDVRRSPKSTAQRYGISAKCQKRIFRALSFGTKAIQNEKPSLGGGSRHPYLTMVAIDDRLDVRSDRMPAAGD
jgi:hypothetical protein